MFAVVARCSGGVSAWRLAETGDCAKGTDGDGSKGKLELERVKAVAARDLDQALAMVSEVLEGGR
jgi:hypothetical protein